MKLSTYITAPPEEPCADVSAVYFVYSFTKCYNEFKIVMAARESMKDEPGFVCNRWMACKSKHEPMSVVLTYHTRRVSRLGVGKTKLAQIPIPHKRPQESFDEIVVRQNFMHLFQSLWLLAHAHSLSLRINFYNPKKQAIPT
jgi:hypothetical protein